MIYWPPRQHASRFKFYTMVSLSFVGKFSEFFGEDISVFFDDRLYSGVDISQEGYSQVDWDFSFGIQIGRFFL